MIIRQRKILYQQYTVNIPELGYPVSSRYPLYLVVHSKFKVVHIVILILCDCRVRNNCPRATNDLIAWNWANDHSLLNESVEQFPARCLRAAVKTECVFVQRRRMGTGE